MKTITRILIILIIITIITIFLGCKKSPEELYENAITQYTLDNDLESKIYLIHNLFENSSFFISEEFNKTDFTIFQNCIYSVKDEEIIINSQKKCKPETQVTFAAYSQSSDLLIYSDGFQLFSKDFKTDSISKPIKITNDDEISIDGISNQDQAIYYFYKRNIFKLNSWNETSTEPLFDETFSPPFTKNIFAVNISQVGSYIALTVGNAGSYNLSLLNSATHRVMLKNTKTASGQIKFHDNQLFYIIGASGKWKIQSYNLNTGNTITLIELKQLKDIRFSGDYIFIKEDEYYYIFDMTENRKLPMFSEIPVEAIGSDHITLKYMDNYYFCNTNILYQNLQKLQARIPGFLN